MNTPAHRAAFYRGNRRVQVETLPPTAPSAREVRVRVAYCGICGSDIHIYHGDMDRRVGFDRIIGHEASGIAEALGEGVTRFRPGDRVAIRPTISCGDCAACRAGHAHVCLRLNCLGLDSHGAFQELWNVPEELLYPLPPNLSLPHAALIEPIAVACHSVKMAAIREGEDVLVIGAGPIGVLTALVAREAGGRVVVSEPHPGRVKLAEGLGFPVIVSGDAVAAIGERTGGKGAEVVFEVSGSAAGAAAMTAAAAARGRIMMVAIHPQPRPVDLLQIFRRELMVLGTRIQEPEDFRQALELLTAGKIPADTLITEIRPLEEIQTVFEEIDRQLGLKTLIRVSG